MTDPGDHVIVSEWADIDRAPEVVSGREKEHVARVFREQSWDHVVWIPTFIIEDGDREVKLLESSDHLAVGDVSDYSDKAWKFTQPHRTGCLVTSCYLPKSQVVVFERLDGVEELNTPQRGLADFARGEQ